MATTNATVVRRDDARPHLRTTYTMARPADGDITITDDVGPLASLVTFDIRNGPVASAKSLLVKATIGRAWHWRPVSELPPHMAMKHVNAYIRTYMVAVADLPAAQYPDAVKRKIAIVLGVARAVCTELYNIDTMDLIPGETAAAYLVAKAAENGDISFGVNGNLTDAQRQILGQPLEFSEAEKAAISSIHMTAIGVLPVQGYSLIMTQHHYLSDAKTQSFKAFQVMERQFWTANVVKEWWDSNLDIMRDALFHKVGHPVLISLKQKLAMNKEIVEKLKTAGCGSAAARLPAVEPQMRTANSYRTLCQTVRTFFESYGGYLNFVVLEQAIEVVNRCPPGVDNPIPQDELPPTVPLWVHDRDDALHYLEQVLQGHTDYVATCFGFYCALSDAAQSASGAVVDDTLRTSYSLTKLAGQSTAAYISGREAYGDYVAHKRAMGAEGRYNPPVFIFSGGRPLPEGSVPTGVGVQAFTPAYEPRQ